MTRVDGSREDGEHGGLLGYVRLPSEAAELCDESLAMRWGVENFWEILAEKKNLSVGKGFRS